MRKRRAGLPLSRERGRGAEAGRESRVNLSILTDNGLRPRHQASANPKYPAASMQTKSDMTSSQILPGSRLRGEINKISTGLNPARPELLSSLIRRNAPKKSRSIETKATHSHRPKTASATILRSQINVGLPLAKRRYRDFRVSRDIVGLNPISLFVFEFKRRTPPYVPRFHLAQANDQRRPARRIVPLQRANISVVRGVVFAFDQGRKVFDSDNLAIVGRQCFHQQRANIEPTKLPRQAAGIARRLYSRRKTSSAHRHKQSSFLASFSPPLKPETPA